MVIEPPGQAGIAGVLEIDDGVLVAIEERRVEGLGGPMRHSGVGELRIRVNGARDEAAEVGG